MANPKVAPRSTQKFRMGKKVTDTHNVKEDRINELRMAQPMTVVKIQEVARRVSEGKSRESIIQYLMDKYEMARSTAETYYGDGVRYLIPKNDSQFRKNLWAKNIARLEHIIERCMEDDDLKEARATIHTLNQMMGFTSNSSIQVAAKTNPDDNSSEFIVKIGE